MDDLKRERLLSKIAEIFYLLENENHDTCEGIQDQINAKIETLEKVSKAPRSRQKIRIVL